MAYYKLTDFGAASACREVIVKADSLAEAQQIAKAWKGLGNTDRLIDLGDSTIDAEFDFDDNWDESEEMQSDEVETCIANEDEAKTFLEPK